MPKTPNHDYNVPNAGAEDWHVPLNENFEQYDTDIEIRDTASGRSNYDPKAGAKFVETDTGLVYVGDGSTWVPSLAYGRYDPSDSAEIAGHVLFGHPANSVDPDESGATIGGGGTANNPNRATGGFSAVGGGASNTASGYDAIVGGGHGNTASGFGSTVGGGDSNAASGDTATVGGGKSNESGGSMSTVGGGQSNESAGEYATVGGGTDSTASGSISTVAGGNANTASGILSTVAGGYDNGASGHRSTVGGGTGNTASSTYATVPGGEGNVAGGVWSFAAGANAKADNANTFVWNDGSDGVESTAAGQFLVNAGGGVGLGTTAPKAPVDVASENNWNLDSNDGDLRVGDDQYRLSMGVATGGGGAGQCNVRAKGGIEELTLGAGTNGPTVRVNPDSVTVEGDLSVSGSKNFVQSVDTDDGEREVYYSAVEAGTPHTEVSGVAELEDGRAEIDLPEHFSLVTDPDEPLMVQVTPHARERVHPQVTERSTHRVVVEEFEGETGSYEVSYTVKGTREGFADEQVVREP